MNVFRLHLRPKGGRANPALSFAYCLREKVLGVGWQIDPPPSVIITWEQYEQLAVDEYPASGALNSVRFLHERVQPEDLIWTRDAQGKYHLAQVQSPWEYLDSDAAVGVRVPPSAPWQ